MIMVGITVYKHNKGFQNKNKRRNEEEEMLTVGIAGVSVRAEQIDEKLRKWKK